MCLRRMPPSSLAPSLSAPPGASPSISSARSPGPAVMPTAAATTAGAHKCASQVAGRDGLRLESLVAVVEIGGLAPVAGRRSPRRPGRTSIARRESFTASGPAGRPGSTSRMSWPLGANLSTRRPPPHDRHGGRRLGRDAPVGRPAPPHRQRAAHPVVPQIGGSTMRPSVAAAPPGSGRGPGMPRGVRSITSTSSRAAEPPHPAPSPEGPTRSRCRGDRATAPGPGAGNSCGNPQPDQEAGPPETSPRLPGACTRAGRPVP